MAKQTNEIKPVGIIFNGGICKFNNCTVLSVKGRGIEISNSLPCVIIFGDYIEECRLSTMLEF